MSVVYETNNPRTGERFRVEKYQDGETFFGIYKKGPRWLDRWEYEWCSPLSLERAIEIISEHIEKTDRRRREGKS